MNSDILQSALSYVPKEHAGLNASAWLEHLPFAHVLVRALQPSSLLELGTHWGASYFCFCETVNAASIPCRCVAVDSWVGEEHSGSYGEEVFAHVSSYNTAHYAAFSELWRMSFDDAAKRVEDGSLDLLHLDGLHSYEAVRHDFDTWWPKLRAGGVMLLHDTHCYHEGFGVWKLWAELEAEQSHHFSFLHGYGLGLLVKEPPSELHPFLQELCSGKQTDSLRALFARLGGDIHAGRSQALERAQVQQELQVQETRIQQLEQQLQKELQLRESRLRTADQELQTQMKQVSALEARLGEGERQIRELESLEQQSRRDAQQLQLTLQELTQQEQSLERQRQQVQEALNREQLAQDQVRRSLSWRLTSPLRLLLRLTQAMRGHPHSLCFSVDSPGKGLRPVLAPRLQVHGWCFVRSSLTLVEQVFVQVGARRILCSREVREDVAARHALPENEVGFRAYVELTPGKHFFQILAEVDGSREALVERWIQVDADEVVHEEAPERTEPEAETQRLYRAWCQRNRWNVKRRLLLQNKLTQAASPRISVVMPVYQPELRFLKAAVCSVQEQVYPHWQLCIADDGSEDLELRSYLEELAAADDRIRVCFREENGHISAATNSAAALADGEWIAFLDQDDALSPDALGELALRMQASPDLDLIYSDEDKIDAEGRRSDPQFKPAWSPELLLSFMYIGHLFALRRSLFESLGGSREGFEGSQDYDLALRAAEQARAVGHVNKVLYHWRAIPGSLAFGGDAKQYSMDAGLRALQEALNRRGIPAKALQPDWAKQMQCGYYSHAFADEGPSVAILIPTRNQAQLLSRLLQSIEQSSYASYTVYILDNGSEDAESLRLFESCGYPRLRIESPASGFNYADLHNQAVSMLSEELLLFLNNDTEVIHPEWLSQMVGVLQMEGVGAVGARLLYADGSLQHAGVLQRLHGGLPGHAFKHTEGEDIGYLGQSRVLRTVSAVTAACMLMRREEFLDMGGFDAEAFAISYNDADLCARLRQRGRRIVYAPSAELLHHEGQSRGTTAYLNEEVAYLQRYADLSEPYYSAHFRQEGEGYRIRARCQADAALGLRGLRVGFFTHNLNLEGAPLQFLEIAQGLQEREQIHPVWISPENGPLREQLEALGMDCQFIPPELSANLAWDYETTIAGLTPWAAGLELDLLFANTVLNFWSIELAQKLGLPSLWLIHESEPPFEHLQSWGPEAQRAAPQQLEHCYQVLFVSEATRNLYSSLLPQGNYSVVRNALDEQSLSSRFPLKRPAAREGLQVGEGERLLLMVGTLCRRKGQAILLKALQEMDPEDLEPLQVILLGKMDPGYQTEFAQELEALPPELRDRIRVEAPCWDVGRYYAAADLFVCASLLESYPKVILEAMYAGLPILTTPVFGISEQVRDGVSARCFPPGDAQALARELQTLLRNPEQAQGLADQARFQLNALPDYEDMLSEYSTLLREALLQ